MPVAPETDSLSIRFGLRAEGEMPIVFGLPATGDLALVFGMLALGPATATLPVRFGVGTGEATPLRLGVRYSIRGRRRRRR